jgi:hypothetical protein
MNKQIRNKTNKQTRNTTNKQTHKKTPGSGTIEF